MYISFFPSLITVGCLFTTEGMTKKEEMIEREKKNRKRTTNEIKFTLKNDEERKEEKLKLGIYRSEIIKRDE